MSDRGRVFSQRNVSRAAVPSDGLTYTDNDFGDLDPCPTCGTRTEAHDPGCGEGAAEAEYDAAAAPQPASPERSAVELLAEALVAAHFEGCDPGPEAEHAARAMLAASPALAAALTPPVEPVAARECPDCGGAGFVVETEDVCCRDYLPTGECCAAAYGTARLARSGPRTGLPLR